MSRLTTAYASKYDLTRVKQIDLFATAKLPLQVNWRGVLDGRTISSVRWSTDAPWSTVLSNPTNADGITGVTIQAAIADQSLLKCQVTLSDGGVLNYIWRVNVPMAPLMGQIANQGPEQVSA